jgi:hypothetical protein
MNIKEKWVEEIMQSIDNLESVEVSEGLHARILQQIPTSQFNALSKPIKWAIAACILILIGLNGFSILHYNKLQQQQLANVNAQNPIYTEFFAQPTQL